MLTERDLNALNQAAELIIGVMERQRIHTEDADERRKLLYFVKNDDAGHKEKNSDVGTSEELTKQGFVEFTDKEIKQMPTHFRRLIIVNKKRCRMRKHVSGKNSTTYEIRFRQDGYNISACGKTIELAKANMLEKLRKAKPSNDNVESAFAAIPTDVKGFAEYYFEKFRKPKLAENTYINDCRRLRNHILPTLGALDLTKVTPSHCEQILDKIKKAGKGKTAEEIYSLLSIIFKGAISHGIIERNPLSIVPNVQHERQHGTALTHEEEKSLFKNVEGSPYEILYALALYCGLRPNEIKSATVQGEFIVAINSKRKNKKVEYKKIPICNRLDEILKKVNNDLRHIDARAEKTLSMRFPSFCPGHKLYDLRTTFYSRCKELGVAEPAMMEFVGHSLGRLGNAYTDLSDKYLLKEGKKLNKW